MAQAQGSSSQTKGNPASKRMSNARLKERRARGWKHAQDRKELRKIAQKEAEQENKARRERGEPTSWQQACAARAARRAAMPKRKTPHRDASILGEAVINALAEHNITLGEVDS